MDFGERTSFEEADRRYDELKRRFDAGEIGGDELDARLRETVIADERGRWWAKSRETGEWYYNSNGSWIRGTPPGYQQSPPGDRSASGHEQEGSGGGRTGQDVGVQPSGGTAALWIAAGIAFALSALVIFPLAWLFGPLGVLFGYLAVRRGARTGGMMTIAFNGVLALIWMLQLLLGFLGALL